MAAKNGRVEVIRAFLEYGVYIDWLDNVSKSPATVVSIHINIGWVATKKHMNCMFLIAYILLIFIFSKGVAILSLSSEWLLSTDVGIEEGSCNRS